MRLRNRLDMDRSQRVGSVLGFAIIEVITFLLGEEEGANISLILKNPIGL